MPIIFEKKEEKPKERGQIIKTGADSSKMNENKDFLKQMFANKGMGMGMGMHDVLSESQQLFRVGCGYHYF